MESQLTKSQRISDAVTLFCGSWTFIIVTGIATTGYLIYNTWIGKPFDPYPYILLNLLVTMVELYQSPLIMMSQNRQIERDRDSLNLQMETHRKEIESVQ